MKMLNAKSETLITLNEAAQLLPRFGGKRIAREFAGFIWFMMTEMQAKKARQVA